MGRRSHTRRLALYMNGERVGDWSLTTGGEELRYAPSWYASPARRPISLRFPLTPHMQAWSGREVHDYFENLLPDTRSIRARLARRFGLDSTDAFPLLAELGRDCVGALQIVPDDAPPPDIRAIHAEPLDEADIAALLRATVNPGVPGTDDRVDLDEFRISLAGAQEKTALLWHDNAWHRPRGATPTTHILKLPLGQVGHMRADLSASVENEWLCSKIMSAYGLAVAHCDMARFEDQKALVVERFDRRRAADGTWLLRLPQEDLCQATGTSYLNKYQSDGGPGIDRVMDLLRTSDHALADRRAFFACQLVFWLLAATDGHAKNFSLRLEAGGGYWLTPFYDVLSAWPMIGNGPNRISLHKARLAMSVNGENAHYRLREIQRRHWNATATRNGLADGGEDILTDLLERTPTVVNAVREQLPAGFPEHVAAPIFAGMLDAARQLAAQPASG